MNRFVVKTRKIVVNTILYIIYLYTPKSVMHACLYIYIYQSYLILYIFYIKYMYISSINLKYVNF